MAGGDQHIEIEQLKKQIATGLFIGSLEAGYRAAILPTIIGTALGTTWPAAMAYLVALYCRARFPRPLRQDGFAAYV
jgi:hypothetical protein